jgi:hypothetical protein
MRYGVFVVVFASAACGSDHVPRADAETAREDGGAQPRSDGGSDAGAIDGGGGGSGVAPGESVTIRGTGFGTHDGLDPLIYDDFERGPAGELVRERDAVTGRWQTGAGDDAVFYTNDVALDGSGAAHHRFRTPDPYNASLALNGRWSALYLDFWIRVDLLDEFSRNFKPWRVYGIDGMERGNDVYFCPADGAGYVGIEPPGVWKEGFYEDGVWMHYEVVMRWGDRSQSVFKHYRDSRVDIAETGFEPAVDAVGEVRIGHYWGMEASGSCVPNRGADIYTDSVYVDDTLARVVIGNADAFDGCTRRAVQRVTAWTDSEITFVANLTALARDDAHTIFVIGPDDEVLFTQPIELAR